MEQEQGLIGMLTTVADTEIPGDSELERAFVTYLRIFAPDIPAPVAQFKFDPKRKWPCDYAWPESRLLVEIEGGTWVNGAHVRPEKYAKDCAKYNRATELGYRVIRFTSDMLHNNPDSCIELVKRMVTGARS